MDVDYRRIGGKSGAVYEDFAAALSVLATVISKNHADRATVDAGFKAFATDRKLPEGGMIQVHLRMPREVVGEDVAEWCFTGRVAHVESLGPQGNKLGVGVQFLYYEVPRASL